MKKIIAALLSSAAFAPAAFAGSTTTNYPSAGAVPFALTTDGSGNAYGRTTLWDSSAAANGASVDSSHGLLVDPGSAALWGVGSIAGSVPAAGGYNAGNAVSSEPSKATTGNLTGSFFDLTGKQVTSPYANRENMVRGSASTTVSAATTIIASGGGSVKNYITDVECGRTDAGTTSVLVTFNDTASTPLVLPNNGGGGGNNKTFNVPLVTAAATAFTFSVNAPTTTVYCSAQGFVGY